MPDTPAKTNITDTPGDGTTITTLVSEHDRGSMEFNQQRGGSPPSAQPAQVVSINPNTAVVGAPEFTLTVTGLRFEQGDEVLFNNGAAPTTYVSATQLTIQVDPGTASGPGTYPVTVRGATGSASFTFTAA